MIPVWAEEGALLLGVRRAGFWLGLLGVVAASRSVAGEAVPARYRGFGAKEGALLLRVVAASRSVAGENHATPVTISVVLSHVVILLSHDGTARARRHPPRTRRLPARTSRARGAGAAAVAAGEYGHGRSRRSRAPPARTGAGSRPDGEAVVVPEKLRSPPIQLLLHDEIRAAPNPVDGPVEDWAVLGMGQHWTPRMVIRQRGAGVRRRGRSRGGRRGWGAGAAVAGEDGSWRGCGHGRRGRSRGAGMAAANDGADAAAVAAEDGLGGGCGRSFPIRRRAALLWQKSSSSRRSFPISTPLAAPSPSAAVLLSSGAMLPNRR
ncbi:hypothetical protein [Oryza sativa Japonica Group]|uniref:Uncharacterized protein n=2 Tax=Oryza TaxID=4527 RepID=Q5N9H0_ORYSJ|nr:hypothetical protein [Oryza sativa Japonica Group]